MNLKNGTYRNRKKQMVNYKNGIVYKLCCKNTEIKDEYIGSTTNFRRRKWEHKSSCNNEESNKHGYYVYQFIRENGGWDNWDMIELEKYSATDKQDLHKRERFWIEELGTSLNVRIPSRNNKEWCQDNKKKVASFKKKYYENNKERIQEWCQNNKGKVTSYKKKYYENNKDAIRLRDKQRREEHRVEISERMKLYYEANKDKLKERRKKRRDENTKKVECECGSIVSKGNLTTHKKTAKHKRLMEALTE